MLALCKRSTSCMYLNHNHNIGQLSGIYIDNILQICKTYFEYILIKHMS